jgi:hypothetical protein
MPELPKILGVPPLPTAIQTIAGLAEDKFATLRASVSGPEGFDRTMDRCEALAKDLQEEDSSKIFALLASLSFLYNGVRDWSEEGDEPSEVLRSFLKSTGLWGRLGDDPGQSFRRLAELVERKPDIDKRRKLRWLRTGILDNAVNFASFVDLRPNFTADRSAIEDLVPVVVFRIGIEREVGEDTSFVFQLSEEGVHQFKEAIDDISKKLSTIRGQEQFSGLIPSDSNVESEEK